MFLTRGIIFDRNGKVIVDNRAAFDVVLLSQYYKSNQTRTNGREARPGPYKSPSEELSRYRSSTAREPSAELLPAAKLHADVSKGNVGRRTEMDAGAFPGVDVEAIVQRRYPYGDIAAQLPSVGYIGEVDNGRTSRVIRKASCSRAITSARWASSATTIRICAA